jgi:hypothetical protein
MNNNYSRFYGKSDNVHAGTYTIQTSGNTPLSGDSINVRDYRLHSYQLIPVEGLISGGLNINISNDNINWTTFKSFTYSNSGEANIAYSDSWHFAYARPVITGSGTYIINESHLA